MKICTFSLCRNDREIAPFFLRYYAELVDQMFVWDDFSNDGTRELLQAHPKVKLYDWPYDNGIDEDEFLRFAERTYPMAIGQFDWCFWVDMDEFIYHPQLREQLAKVDAAGFEAVRTKGFNMLSPEFPKDDGRQIIDIVRTGVDAPVYSKPVVFKPSAKMKWNRGKHALENCNPRITPEAMVKLLHYRYMGLDYTRFKNVKNFDRVGLKTGDKSAAWSCNPNWTGEHSPQWALKSIPLSYDVLESPLP